MKDWFEEKSFILGFLLGAVIVGFMTIILLKNINNKLDETLKQGYDTEIRKGN
jgi:predicted small secreted protein